MGEGNLRCGAKIAQGGGRLPAQQGVAANRKPNSHTAIGIAIGPVSATSWRQHGKRELGNEIEPLTVKAQNGLGAAYAASNADPTGRPATIVASLVAAPQER